MPCSSKSNRVDLPAIRAPIPASALNRASRAYCRNYMFNSGLDKILKKVGEEATETIVAAKNTDSNRLISETSDLIYHLLVLLVERGVTLDEIRQELRKRRTA